tara:strand:- start:168 stop:389 length:222 start_codon:yes stop_codon:yes gene_type:complete
MVNASGTVGRFPESRVAEFISRGFTVEGQESPAGGYSPRVELEEDQDILADTKLVEASSEDIDPDASPSEGLY